jgi:hypothetical protein
MPCARSERPPASRASQPAGAFGGVQLPCDAAAETYVPRQDGPSPSQARLLQPVRAATIREGGVPERSNGAVLKTAGGRKVARGFESHPRR